MNEELVQQTVKFFKEQGGTYATMKEQMLEGGIPLVEINRIYEEIKRLGADPHPEAAHIVEPAHPLATNVIIHPASREMSPEILSAQPSHQEIHQEAPSPLTTNPVSEPLAQVIPQTAEVAPPPQQPLPSMQAPISVMPIVDEAPQSHAGVLVFISLILLLGISAGGVFAYIKYMPESSLARIINELLHK